MSTRNTGRLGGLTGGQVLTLAPELLGMLSQPWWTMVTYEIYTARGKI